MNNIKSKIYERFFKPKSNARIRPFDIIVHARKTTNLCNKHLKGLSPKTWNQLPTEIKSETSFLRFKKYVKT